MILLAAGSCPELPGCLFSCLVKGWTAPVADFLLEMNGITKTFPGVKALDHVSFCVKKGEIHCLVGENGAGKSTLVKVLAGVHPHGSFEGDILVGGKKQQFYNTADSERASIAIISQELALVPDFTIYENIFFGHEILKGSVIDWPKTIGAAAKLLDKVGLKLKPAAKAMDLSVGQQQLVEIAKAISKNAKLLILDEPTASLNENDSRHLLGLLRELRDHDGVTVILISHRLHEVIAIADTVTVLRDGGSVCSLDAGKGEINEQDIIRLMVGRVFENIYPARRTTPQPETVFEVRDFSALHARYHQQVLKNVSLHVKKGEIVGLAGLMGAGRTEFALAVFGNTPRYRITSGECFVHGEKQLFSRPSDAIAAGLSYVTEDRKKKGLVLIRDVCFNITLANLKALEQGLVINQNEEITAAKEYQQALNIKATSIRQLVLNLSGGNQQKVSLAKWLYAQPSVLILDEPTRGIDVGARHEIYTIMNALVEKGMSILMISSDLLEILGMSDRIYVMAAGRITGELDAGEATQEKIMRMATDE